MDELSLVQKIIVWSIPVIFAITLHEVAHGWTALRFGDRTAQMMGRLTLNPIKHIDPLGTLVVPALLLMVGGFIFGWAKPVPINARNMRQPKQNMTWVALAGPMANLVMAVFWALIARLGLGLSESGVAIGEAMLLMGIAGILINGMLMLLNLLPLPPLDGGRILVSLLPDKIGWQVSRVEPYGFFILLGLLYFGILAMVLWPMMQIFLTGLSVMFNLPPGVFAIL